MKKIFKSVLFLISTALLASGTYYFVVVHSKGSEKIRYIEPESDYHSFSELLQHPDLSGKVVYVDYWHTGCGPCLREFEHLPALKQKFMKDTDLVFLYLGKDRSVPGEKFRWKKMTENRGLSGIHYFMTDETYYQFWDETVKDTTIVQAFPHHLIIDREGRIVNENAPRPGDELLETALRNVLDEKKML